MRLFNHALKYWQSKTRCKSGPNFVRGKIKKRVSWPTTKTKKGRFFTQKILFKKKLTDFGLESGRERPGVRLFFDFSYALHYGAQLSIKGHLMLSCVYAQTGHYSDFNKA